jgi:hypothetical protein
VGFEPTISASELPQTYVFDRAATGTDKPKLVVKNYMLNSDKRDKNKFKNSIQKWSGLRQYSYNSSSAWKCTFLSDIWPRRRRLYCKFLQTCALDCRMAYDVITSYFPIFWSPSTWNCVSNVHNSFLPAWLERRPLEHWRCLQYLCSAQNGNMLCQVLHTIT